MIHVFDHTASLDLCFRSDDEKFSYGRPVDMTIGPDDSLLVSDDAGTIIWRSPGREDSAGDLARGRGTLRALSVVRL